MRKLFSTRSLAALAIGALALAGATVFCVVSAEAMGNHGNSGRALNGPFSGLNSGGMQKGPFGGLNKGGDKFGKGPFGGLNKGSDKFSKGPFKKGPFGKRPFGKGPFGATILVLPVGGKHDCHREWRTVFVPGIGLARVTVRVCD